MVSDAASVGEARTVAAALVEARAAGRALPAFPGRVPASLDEAYAIQEEAIALTPDQLAGWKVAMIPLELRERFGAERICGPIFRKSVVQSVNEGEPTFRVVPAGFAAVEAEFVLEIGEDVPPDPPEPGGSADPLLPYLRASRAGVEVAGSPIADLNGLGSAAVVSDFGGNAGLIVGPVIDLSHRPGAPAMTSETFVDGAPVGSGDSTRVPGGPLAALRFLLAQLASRGRRLSAGDFVSTGATTGIHPVRPGSRIKALFDGSIGVRGVAARAGS